MSDTEHDFTTGNTGASMTYPMQCSALRKNGYVVIKGRPCKIVDISIGDAEVHLVAIDIFTGKQYEDLSPLTHHMDVPNVERREYALCSIEDGFLSLLTLDGISKEDIRLPGGEVGDAIQASCDSGKDTIVTVLSAMGEEQAISCKDNPNQ